MSTEAPRPELVELPDGTMQWKYGDVLHRDDGPAIVYPDGARLWYSHGRLHREDGPAAELPDGTTYWYVGGRPVTGTRTRDQQQAPSQHWS